MEYELNMPHWSWINFERQKIKPLHERLVDEVINRIQYVKELKW